MGEGCLKRRQLRYPYRKELAEEIFGRKRSLEDVWEVTGEALTPLKHKLKSMPTCVVLSLMPTVSYRNLTWLSLDIILGLWVYVTQWFNTHIHETLESITSMYTCTHAPHNKSITSMYTGTHAPHSKKDDHQYVHVHTCTPQ